MNTKLMSAGLSVTALFILSGGAFAQQISSQAQLATLLGGNETMEDFEGNGKLGSGQITGTFLDSNSTFGGFGPGLVKPGAAYSSPGLYWNDNAYFGLNTRTLGDSSSWRGFDLTITYTQPVTAMGFDMQGYSGFTKEGSVSVYDTANHLISSTNVDGGFFGWQATGGIGKVVVSANPNNTNSYIMIDNHGFGSAVPEPASLAVLSLGALGMLVRRRKNRS